VSDTVVMVHGDVAPPLAGHWVADEEPGRVGPALQRNDRCANLLCGQCRRLGGEPLDHLVVRCCGGIPLSIGGLPGAKPHHPVSQVWVGHETIVPDAA
jgi:hypothetical protein